MSSNSEYWSNVLSEVSGKSEATAQAERNSNKIGDCNRSPGHGRSTADVERAQEADRARRG